ncbi:MAG: AAA family ATPase [Deltaproteobacteria bacterium]|nr:AAA family ATPase [Deltaproteobacteria bacterium]
MKTIAFFNNKGGVGKTSLVYHLAWMLSELDCRILAADLDPQANLSGMFLSERRLEELWEDNTAETIERSISPLFEGTGDIIESPCPEKIDERIGLLVGDLALSKREDELSSTWPKCLDRDARAFRVTTAFARLISRAGKEFQADLALVDVGPNLGAINRAAMIASDYVVIPLAPDLFSLQGLRNVGPTLIEWRGAWQERTAKKPSDLNLDLPLGGMNPLGYIIMRHTVRLNRPVKAFAKWIEKIPAQYMQSVMGGESTHSVSNSDEQNCLAHLKDYYSLMPMAQDVNKPMFMLKPADGVFGAQQKAVKNCYEDFHKLAKKILNLLGKDK